MPIKLSLTKEGNIEINVAEQSNFSMDDEGVILVLPFKTVNRNKNSVVVDPQDNLNITLEYLLRELKENNYPVALDEALSTYWNNYSFEKEKINRLKKKRTFTDISSSQIQNYFKRSRKLFAHQICAIQHALDLDFAANFSVPGSGKTQTTLGIFYNWKEKHFVDKALVIGPASCFDPWENEIRESLEIPLKTLRWSGSISKRQKLGAKIKESDIILVTYQTACNDKSLIEQLLRKFKILLIVDESHYIKNPNGVRAQALLRLAPYASKRIILTGTPAPHSLADIWTQFSFLWPSRQLLGNFYDFQQKIEHSDNTAKKIGKELKPFFSRTTKKELGLPDIKQENYLIKEKDIPSEQRKIIEFLELKTLAEARKYSLSDLDMNILRDWRKARIIRLLQAASNPALLLKRLDLYNIRNDFDIDTSDLIDYVSVFIGKKKIPAKIQAVLDKTFALLKAGKKVVIWSWFIDNILYLNELLKEYNPLMVYGEIRPYIEKEDIAVEESREKNIRDFKNRTDRPILLANPAACAESISLHKHCQNAIYLDRNFNCGQFLQSMDRIHRVGMPAGTTANYYMPFINCAIERAVDNRLKRRQKILYELLNDPMPVLGIDDEAWVSDSEEELEDDFNEVVKEIAHEKTKKSS